MSKELKASSGLNKKSLAEGKLETKPVQITRWIQTCNYKLWGSADKPILT